MEASRIRNPDLAALPDEGELAWHRYITPITGHYAGRIAQRDYRGKRLAYWGHITRQNTIMMMLALKQAGAEIVIGACNVDSTDDIAAAYAVSKGIPVFGWQEMANHYIAVMLLGIAWMFDGMPDDIASGLLRYPAHLEREVAELSVRIHR